MTGVDEDLATPLLIEHCEQHSANLSMEPTPFQLEQAVNFLVATVPTWARRVEDELSRLREEDAGYARTIVALWEEIAPGESYEELGGATIVELATRLREERDELRRALTDELDNWNPERRPTITAEKEAAEARCARLQDERDDARAMTRIANSRSAEERERCARLQQALERIAEMVPNAGRLETQAVRIAREALAGPDMPAEEEA